MLSLVVVDVVVRPLGALEGCTQATRIGQQQAGRQLCSKKSGFQMVAVTVDGNILCFFKIDVYEIISDLTEASSGSRRHGAEKSGSTVLLRDHSIGVDYELSALFEKHANVQRQLLEKVPFSLQGGFFMEFMVFALPVLWT